MDYSINLPHSIQSSALRSGGGLRTIPWLETVLLTALGPVVNLGLDSADPFLVRSGFPWLVFVPMLIGLRHGLACSISSALMLAVGAYLAWQHGLVHLVVFPGSFVTGLLTVSLISSEFRAHWWRRLERLATSEEYCRTRLDQFAKTYHILKVSHDNLEQQISGSTKSLRGALSDLQKRLISLETVQGLPFRGAAGTILQLFADYGMLQMAALYEMSPDGFIRLEPAACLGKPRPIKLDEPILLAAIRHRRAVAISPHTEHQGSSVMAVVPIVDIFGEIYGVLAIDELPFIALQTPNLNLLSVFGGHIGDCLLRWSGVGSDLPNELGRFQEDIQRSVLDAQKCAVPAMLIGMSLGPAWAEREFLEKVILNCRGLDRMWINKSQPDGVRVLKLLPGTNQIGAERYIWRLDRLMKAHFGVPLSSDGLAIKLENVDGRLSAAEIVTKFTTFFSSVTCDTAVSHRHAQGTSANKGQQWSLYSS